MTSLIFSKLFFRYKPIYLERGRKLTFIRPIVIVGSDINLSTSRGDGNQFCCVVIEFKFSDINLSTSRGDGN